MDQRCSVKNVTRDVLSDNRSVLPRHERMKFYNALLNLYVTQNVKHDSNFSLFYFVYLLPQENNIEIMSVQGKVLVLGAGLVTKPLVHYLSKHNFHVIVANRTLQHAEELIKGMVAY